MSLEPAETVVGSTGHIWRAPVGTAFPTNITAEVDETLWTDLGYVTEEGPRFNFGRETNELMAWQSYDPIRMLIAKVPKEIQHDFLQWNMNTLATAMGGGTWTGTDPNYQYEPPDESYIDFFAEIIEIVDGDYSFRFCFRKVQNTSGVEFAATRDSAMILPVTVKVLAADDGAKPFLIQTNDPNLGDATEAGS